jgi:Tfp pilus assembly protein PilE
MRQQHGISLMNLIVTLAVLGFLAVMAAKLVPTYIEYFKVKKIFSAMVAAGDTKGTVGEIRKSYQRRNTIEDVHSVTEQDIEITKEGGETVLSATWSAKVPLVSNISACIDFSVTTANSQPAQ